MKARRLSETAAVAAWAFLASLMLTATSQATATITNMSPSFGTVGTSVTIYGTNFGTSTGTVTFNGTSASVNTWASNKVTVTVPSSATTGLVTVTPHNGTAVNSTAEFIVLASNAALAMGAFPPQMSDCGLIPSQYDCITDYQTYVLPSTDGIVVVVPWSSIDLGNSSQSGPGCTSGASSSTCTWSALDNLVTTYVGQTNWDSSKKVSIVISPISDGGCSGNKCNTDTPAYVFTSSWATTAGGTGTNPLHECNCTNYQGDSGAPHPVGQCWNSSSNSDTSGMPAVWEAPFYVALEKFHKHVVEHLNSSSFASYSPYIAYVRLGLSSGGEEFPHCSAELETLVSPQTAAELQSVWTSYANTMFTNASTLGAQYPLMAAPNANGSTTGVPSDAWADTEAQDALNQGLTLGSEGLQSHDTFVSHCAVLSATDGSSSNNWCYTYSPNFTPAPAVHELQTLANSDPSENTCTTDYFNVNNTNSQNTGSLVCLLPFIEGKANSFEGLLQDMFLAFDPHYSGNGTYGSAYSTAISNLRAGK